jgi:hypothetical protein|tara:strand:+ start:544 stop:837 length:294 start_codon:yes stop_codon:yes gene_type:complete
MSLEEMGIDMPEEARKRLFEPSNTLQTILMSRLAEMEVEELQMLDKAITPQVMRVLTRLLPELAMLIEQVADKNEPQMNEQEQKMPEDDMGALKDIA